MISSILVGILPFILTLTLIVLDFNMDTSSVLSMFLSLVWGILFALGGGVVYLNNHQVKDNLLTGKIIATLAEKTKSFALILIAHTMVFIVLSILYPVRDFIFKTLKLTPTIQNTLSLIGDSLLFSTILIPALFSVIVGATCLLVSFNSDNFKTK